MVYGCMYHTKYKCVCVDGAVLQSSSACQQAPAISVLGADAESADSEAPPAHVSATYGAAALPGGWVESSGPPSFPPTAVGFQHFRPRAPSAADGCQHFGLRADVFPSLPPGIVDMDDNFWSAYGSFLE